MRISNYLLLTIKKISKNTKNISHELMIRSGMIKKLTTGIYTWLPTGLRVLHKIQNIIREEMNKIKAIEILMPIMQPKYLWENSGRLLKYGSELINFYDRVYKSFVLGPTHEEIITNLIKNEINSYKDLPLILYQIQTKFRDEIRPRFGVIRSREFIMKDAYSFHINKDSLIKTYNIIKKCYLKFFNRIGLKCYIVQADTGSIGGLISHEFHTLSKNGESNIVFSTKSDYVANIDLAKSLILKNKFNNFKENLNLVNINNIKKINNLKNQFLLPKKKLIKIFIVRANLNSNCKFIVLIIRSDHTLNKFKVEKLSKIASPLSIINNKDIYSIFKVDYRFLGPINLLLPIIIDYDASIMNNFIIGANVKNKYFFGVNWKRDLPLFELADLRNIINNDISPDGNGLLKIKKSIELAHIFQLGIKYSKIFKTFIKDKKGSSKNLTMGCYGIGIARTISSIIEQNHDKNGIIWPQELAPFVIAILPVNMFNSIKVKKITENIYYKLKKFGFDVLLDDRRKQIGLMFSDIELIGIPHILIISDRNLNKNVIEYQNRKNKKPILISLNNIITFITKKILINR